MGNEVQCVIKLILQTQVLVGMEEEADPWKEQEMVSQASFFFFTIVLFFGIYSDQLPKDIPPCIPQYMQVSIRCQVD